MRGCIDNMCFIFCVLSVEHLEHHKFKCNEFAVTTNSFMAGRVYDRHRESL